MYYVVGAPQNLHFKQLFATCELMGYDWAKRCRHINFGMVRKKPDGDSSLKAVKMSSSKGTDVFLSSILDTAQAVMLEQMAASKKSKIDEISEPLVTADVLGISSLVIQDCSAHRIRDYEFSWDRLSSFEGDTGPYIQYNHARLCGIERKADESHGWKVSSNVEFSLLLETQCHTLLLLISKFPYVVYTALATQETSPLVRYLLDLSHAISHANTVLNVIHADEPTGLARLALFGAARQVLNKALKLLGLIPLEFM